MYEAGVKTLSAQSRDALDNLINESINKLLDEYSPDEYYISFSINLCDPVPIRTKTVTRGNEIIESVSVMQYTSQIFLEVSDKEGEE